MTSGEIDQIIAELGAQQHGLLHGEQAKRRGVPKTALKHRRAKGLLILLKRDIYRLRDHPWTWEAQLQAALLDGGPGSVVSHRSAARLHECWRYRNDDTVEITIPEMHDHLVTLGRAHRSSLLPINHRTVIAGFPVTTIARTCFDLVGDPDPGLRRRLDVHEVNMRRVINDAIGRRGMTLAQFAAVRASIGKRGRPGSAMARELIKYFREHTTPTQSDGESLVLEIVEGLGLPAPEQQVPMSDERGWIGNVDFLWDDAALVLEMDGGWHDGPLDKAADAARDARVEALGYEVWRWKYERVLVDTPKYARQLELRVDRDAMAARSTQHSGRAS